jgi:DNA-3-methyladenine glycosylase
MIMGRILPRKFYARDTLQVAEDILGKLLVRVKGRSQMIGKIVEVEAYKGSEDPASHAYRGITRRNAPMFAEGGHAYIYFTYGNHYCLNVTTERSGVPGAVLIRALEPMVGLQRMRILRPAVSDHELTNGPGKLTKALGIDTALNDLDMTKRGPLFVTDAESDDFKIKHTPRVGITRGTERLWRVYVADNPFVSRR